MYEGEILEFTSPLYPAQRAMFILAGLLAIVVPSWQLVPGLIPVSVATPFFAAIIGGAITVGVAFLWGGIFGQRVDWRVGHGAVTLHTRSLIFRRTLTLTSKDVAEIVVRRLSWDSRSDSFCVVIKTRSGKHYETPDYGAQAKAQALKDTIIANLYGTTAFDGLTRD